MNYNNDEFIMMIYIIKPINFMNNSFIHKYKMGDDEYLICYLKYYERKKLLWVIIVNFALTAHV